MKVKLAPCWLAAILRWQKFAGITLPPFGIYIIVERFSDARLIAHEKVHWQQYQRMGLLKYYVMYIWYWLKFGYDKHPMEQDPRNAERSI